MFALLLAHRPSYTGPNKPLLAYGITLSGWEARSRSIQSDRVRAPSLVSENLG